MEPVTESKVSIVIPTYNESRHIVPLIEEILKFLPGAEIIVVDDDSPDKTWLIVEEYKSSNVKVIRRIGKRGLASAIGEGLEAANGSIIGWMDADMCMPPRNLEKMMDCLSGSDIVIGSRYVCGGKDTRGIFRRLTSRAINCFAGLLLGFGIKDYDSGFIVLKRSVLDAVPFPGRGYGDYFIELIFECKRAGFKIKEVPYVFIERVGGASKTMQSIFTFIKYGFGYVSRIVFIRFFKNR